MKFWILLGTIIAVTVADYYVGSLWLTGACAWAGGACFAEYH